MRKTLGERGGNILPRHPFRNSNVANFRHSTLLIFPALVIGMVSINLGLGQDLAPTDHRD
ncbi:hypothetical protein Sulac_1051 [Sulfobacillus acidophilus DSM 10332]|uniref:Uncharacterized protein n=1 Tax=Sulfobacillus acidophilus (strain ATCC 700253 / DSM 10332 / NAL) TaxID=679936 RepID=G8TTW0_SULAD|nr:hypothetical protein Sulac_1051 [Sulfobacillus acidophilus DSM 10332]